MAFRRIPFLMVALLGIDFLDEFSSGVPTVGVPGIKSAFDLTYSTAAFIVFTAPIFASLVLEPPLFVLADRHPKKYFVCGGLFAMALLALVIGLSGVFWVVALALLFSGTASGCGVSLAQAVLMDADPENRERTMVRWTFMGTAGDLATPALFWLLALFALGWREAFVISGAILALYALVLVWQTFPSGGVRETEENEGKAEDSRAPSLRVALGAGLRNRRLLLWSSGVWLCSLLDEILVAFGALWLRDGLGADAATRSVILMCFMGGGMLGLLLLARLLGRTDPLRLLRVAAIGSGVSYLAWLCAETPVSSGVWMFAAGLFASALYPLAKAQAYRALPDRSGLVNAVSHVFTPLDVLMPLALGLIADSLGLLAALALLLAQPFGLFAIATFAERRPDAAPA